MSIDLGVLAAGIDYGGWKFSGNFVLIDLIAASTNALNGALLARRPDHYRNFTIVGILLMALFGGLGGGITRDVLLNKIPGAFTNPAYITVCLIAGIIGYQLAFAEGQLFREGLFQFMTSFSLPWYAIAGAQAAVTAGLPVVGILAIAVIGPTAGRFYIDITSGVPPKQFIRGEWFVSIALLTGAVWLVCYAVGLGTWASAGISFAIGLALRLLALYRGWEEPLAKEPAGVYQHSDGRPLLGRKLKGKSVREMKDLGLTVSKPGEIKE
ncbi:TRIC cation channel family protein [Kribbella sp. NPDC050281]|uniref:trimeric intracellular cation channel family protein n=1 Tax=Kribbella sp. NPDC050281 TaxID=3155515 RepID=UPI003410EDA8